MRTIEMWGPWAAGLDPCERLARTRALRAVARIMAGRRAADLCAALARAETDASGLEEAHGALNRLGSLDMRRIVGSYGGLTSAHPSRRVA
ncbi:hypothetical protein QO012_002568 [Methylobacterium aerolatum]|uniref:Uncharacterized protein n=1 Tax=Methylobacterium aerolatum TaxID=418708 RepID=A0ABU0I203_9HYPH|nr:hypothetical protein [Methylobacterium aerolatum]GJD36466.1 hypothetical protein FMGBMHLM_3386 [Methylobacterium aerolatum]